MTSVVVAILVVTLLVPGLAMLAAVVIRYLFRGARPPSSPPDESDDPEPPVQR